MHCRVPRPQAHHFRCSPFIVHCALFVEVVVAGSGSPSPRPATTGPCSHPPLPPSLSPAAFGLSLGGARTEGRKPGATTLPLEDWPDWIAFLRGGAGRAAGGAAEFVDRCTAAVERAVGAPLSRLGGDASVDELIGDGKFAWRRRPAW
jgi:hypothetical protein